MALPQEYRLKRKIDFEQIKRDGRLCNDSLFSLLLVKDKSQDPSLFGFVISKKIDLRAVVRNRLRRLFSEPIRVNIGKINPGYKILFLVKKSSLQNQSNIFPSILRILRDEGVIVK